MATGHFVQTNSAGELLRGVDPNKDQSYFLYMLKDWQLKQEARQDAVLFLSLCGIREGEPFLAPGEKRQLEPVRFQPEGPLGYASLETIQEGRIREEVLRLHRETGEELMKGRRYEIRMPGTEPGEIFPETGIWAEGRK